MKHYEQVTTYPYGYHLTDLKSGTPEKDRLQTDIFDTSKLIEEKMSVDEGSVDTNDKGFWLLFNVPVNNFSVMLGPRYLPVLWGA